MSGIWTISYIAMWVIIAGLTFTVVGLLRQLGLIQLRLGVDPGALITTEGIARGVPAPDFEAADVGTGKRVRLAEFRGQRVMLVFLTTGCLACRELVPHLNEVAREYRDSIQFLTVCYGDVPACSYFARTHHLEITMLSDPTNVVATSYGITATPFAFLIGEQGLVLLRGVANSWPQLEALLKEEGTLQTRDFLMEDLPDRDSADTRWRKLSFADGGGMASAARVLSSEQRDGHDDR